MSKLDIILAPVVSEKSMRDANSNKFTFKVSMASNKKSIKKAIEDKFKVNVLNISTIIVKGRKSRAGKKRLEILQSPWKKAIARLKPGEKIALFDIGGKSKWKV